VDYPSSPMDQDIVSTDPDAPYDFMFVNSKNNEICFLSPLDLSVFTLSNLTADCVRYSSLQVGAQPERICLSPAIVAQKGEMGWHFEQQYERSTFFLVSPSWPLSSGLQSFSDSSCGLMLYGDENHFFP